MQSFRLPLFIWPETTLDEVVELLHKSPNSYFDFLGHELDSNITIEEAYQEVYGMTREEYRTEIQKLYEEHKKRMAVLFEELKKEAQEREERILNRAKGIIPENQMDIYEKAYSLLGRNDSVEGENRNNEYLELISYLNNDDYSLEKATEMFKKIRTRYVDSNAYLLKSIKLLSKHGAALYDLLYDEAAVKRFKESRKRFIKTISKITKSLDYNRPLTQEEELTSYDRILTAHRLLGYSLSKKEGKTLK